MTERGLVEAPLGRAWEGLHGWLPVVRGCDELMEMPPASEAYNVHSPVGRPLYPVADVVSTAELLSFQVGLNELHKCRPIWIGPEQLAALPDWPAAEDEVLAKTAAEYARDLQLPFDPLFLDFTGANGEPAWLERAMMDVKGKQARVALYGALIMRVDYGVGHALFTDGSLVVVPFGCDLSFDGAVRSPVHVETEEGFVRMPSASSLGYCQFGGLPAGHKDEWRKEVTFTLGESYFNVGRAPRPMMAVLHTLPLAEYGEYRVHCTVGIGSTTHATMVAHNREHGGARLGVYSVDPESQTWEDTVAEGTLVATQAQQALKALYLLESANVELDDAPVSRQVRRQAERSKGKTKIAKIVRVRLSHRRSVRRRSSGRGFSHSFDRIGYYRHVTRGSHAKPEELKPCPIWDRRHPHTQLCRREYVPPTVVNAGDDKPYVPKVRVIHEQPDA